MRNKKKTQENQPLIDLNDESIDKIDKSHGKFQIST